MAFENMMGTSALIICVWQSEVGDCVIVECYEVKIEESEKAGSSWESNPGHLWLEPPVLCHSAMTAGQPPALTISYMYHTGGTECLSRTPGSHSACAIRTPFVVDPDRNILSIRKKTMLSGFSYSKCSEHNI